MFRHLLLLLLVVTLAAIASFPAAAIAGDCATGVAEAPLDLNTATLEQLDRLPGIGPALAERIIAWRDAHGPFVRVEQLEEVHGIGARTVEKLQPCLVVE